MSSFHKKTGVDQQLGRGPGLREFVVGEPIEEYSDMPAVATQTAPMRSGYELSATERDELRKFRQDTVERKNKVGEHAKKRIELLADIGRLKKDVMLEGCTFSLRTLKTKEARDATMSIFDCKNDAEAAFEIRRQSLARSLFQIDGQDIEIALGSNDFNLKLELIDNMEEVTVSKLDLAFTELRQEVNTKYGLNTESQVKEVSEDIKK